LTIDSITPDGGCANITLTATLPDGYTGQVQASWDGSTDWINIGDAYSVDELAAGVAIALSEGQAYFRIQLIGDECIAGYSVSVPVGCTCATLDVDGFEYVFGEDGLHVAYSFTDNIGAGWVTGGGRYRINGGAWITYSPVSGVPFENPEVLVDGDVIEFQLFNSLQPGCPPHSYQLTVVE
jgi:hypothetical protein